MFNAVNEQIFSHPDVKIPVGGPPDGLVDGCDSSKKKVLSRFLDYSLWFERSLERKSEHPLHFTAFSISKGQ